jgi:hypothetical protein
VAALHLLPPPLPCTTSGATFHLQSRPPRQHVIERRELRALIATVTEAEEGKAAEAEHAHVTAREEIRNRSTDRIQELSRTLDDRIMELESAFEQAHVNYLHATDAKTESFKGLVADNARAEKRILKRAEAVERAKAALVSLRNKMAANAREYEEKCVRRGAHALRSLDYALLLRASTAPLAHAPLACPRTVAATAASLPRPGRSPIHCRCVRPPRHSRALLARQRAVAVCVRRPASAAPLAHPMSLCARRPASAAHSHAPPPPPRPGRNESLAREKVEQAGHVAALKARLDAFRAQSDGRLQKLSVAVRSARSTMDSNVALASRILQAAERCRQLEGEGDKVWPQPIADVAAGTDEGAVIAGPGASTRAGAALAAAATAASGAGDAVVSAVSGRAMAPAPGLLHLQAATTTITSGALVPSVLTAARHGYVPRADADGGMVERAKSAGVALASTLTGAAGGAGGLGEGALSAAMAALDDVAYADVKAAAEVESKLMRDTVESGELDALDLFWRRYNKALMEQLVLERRRGALAAENAQLKEMLSQCLEGAGISDSALARADGNPLFVVNGRTGINPAVAAALGRPLPVAGGAGGGGKPVHRVTVDAGLTVRAYAMQAGR